MVELDEAKFGKRKYHKGNYREGMWVLGAIDRQTKNCFLVPCPGNKRDAATLLPIINRWILPGSIVHTDEWSAYNGLTSLWGIPKRDSGIMLSEQLLVLEILKCL